MFSLDIIRYSYTSLYKKSKVWGDGIKMGILLRFDRLYKTKSMFNMTSAVFFNTLSKILKFMRWWINDIIREYLRYSTFDVVSFAAPSTVTKSISLNICILETNICCFNCIICQKEKYNPEKRTRKVWEVLPSDCNHITEN